jgi:hypothetical protein
MWHWFRYIFNERYREKYLKEKKMQMTHYVKSLRLAVSYYGDDEPHSKYEFGVTFFQNQLGDRAYKVIGHQEAIKQRWTKTEWYREAEIWKNGGLMPLWAKDVLIEKLSQ